VCEQLLAQGCEVVSLDIQAPTWHHPKLHAVQVDLLDRQATAEHILIAVGSVPAPPPVDADHETILTSDDIVNLAKLPKSLAIVGGGVIGIEYASMFAELGVEVTVVDRHERMLDFCDLEIVEELMHQMRQKRVTFRLGEAVKKIRGIDNPRGAAIDHESGKHIEVDAVLFSLGRIGATRQLALDKAGITADDRGRLKVNDTYQTDVPHISAAGDVIGFPALASTSSEQGRLAVCHMFGVEAKPTPAGFPYGIYAIPEISMVGATEQELTAQKVPYEVGVARYEEIARGQILGDSSGVFKMIFHRETRKLLGVHCIGTQATELVHIGQAVLTLGGGLDYVLETVFNYPTLAECYKVAAYNAANHMRGA
jgi:NAD(P) transhydrogenase